MIPQNPCKSCSPNTRKQSDNGDHGATNEAPKNQNGEDSRQYPIGHPKLSPPSYLSKFHHWVNLLQQCDTMPPWPWHVVIGQWKEPGVVPPFTKELENVQLILLVLFVWSLSNCCCQDKSDSTETNAQPLNPSPTTKMQLYITAAQKSVLCHDTIAIAPSTISTDDKPSMPSESPKMTT